eukprot:12407674-Karenia_brevis.AAC.1
MPPMIPMLDMCLKYGETVGQGAKVKQEARSYKYGETQIALGIRRANKIDIQNETSFLLRGLTYSNHCGIFLRS